AEQCAGHGVVEMSIAEHDERRLAPKLESHLLECGGRIRHHRLSRRHLAGERDLADGGVSCEQLSGLRISLHYLEHSFPHARLAIDLTELHRRKWCELGGLEDHGIAAGKRRGRLPTSDLQRIVPGADSRNDAERLAARVAERLRPEIEV